MPAYIYILYIYITYHLLHVKLHPLRWNQSLLTAGPFFGDSLADGSRCPQSHPRDTSGMPWPPVTGMSAPVIAPGALPLWITFITLIDVVCSPLKYMMVWPPPSLSLSQPYLSIMSGQNPDFLRWKSTFFVKLITPVHAEIHTSSCLIFPSPHLFYLREGMWNPRMFSVKDLQSPRFLISGQTCPTWGLPIQQQRHRGVDIAGVDGRTTGVNQGRGHDRFHVWMELQKSVQRLTRPQWRSSQCGSS